MLDFYFHLSLVSYVMSKAAAAARRLKARTKRGRPRTPQSKRPTGVLTRFPPKILLAIDQWCLARRIASRPRAVTAMVEAALAHPGIFRRLPVATAASRQRSSGLVKTRAPKRRYREQSLSTTL